MIRIDRTHCQTNPAQINIRWQAFHYFIPCCACISAAVYCAFRTTTDVSKNFALALMCCSIQYITISRIDHHFIKSCMLTNIQNLLPCFTTISCFINTSFSSIIPKRTVCCYINYISIIRIYSYFTNVLR